MKVYKASYSLLTVTQFESTKETDKYYKHKDGHLVSKESDNNFCSIDSSDCFEWLIDKASFDFDKSVKSMEYRRAKCLQAQLMNQSDILYK